MADDEKPDAVDLFGNVVYSKKGKRGRPPFEWTQENSNKISMLLSLGWSNSRIAACVLDPRTGKAISEPTLKRYFRSELFERNAMADRAEARRFERVWLAAEAGNIGAERLLGQMIEKSALMGLGRKFDGEAKPQTKSDQKLGKKEAARQAAHESAEDTPWGSDLDLPGFRPN
ncbi:hypothetical protein VXL47_12230 [Phaeobacter sp. JH20_30]|uniref:hypothetical protein n=2 Tax=Phaeobacter TaxID=302485 RepID=UPI003A87F746